MDLSGSGRKLQANRKPIDPSYVKDNPESALSTNKEAISHATMNLMESLILAQDERWRHA